MDFKSDNFLKILLVKRSDYSEDWSREGSGVHFPRILIGELVTIKLKFMTYQIINLSSAVSGHLISSHLKVSP